MGARRQYHRLATWLRPLTGRTLLLLLSCALGLSGCINGSAMLAKMILGDPQVDASFKQRTGVSLEDEHRVVLVVTAPTSLGEEHSSVTLDLQEILARKLERRGIELVDVDDVARAIDDQGGRLDVRRLARKFPEADYLLHISVGSFSCREPQSAELLRGHAAGMLLGYELRGDEPDERHCVQVFEQEFTVEHPTHPVPRDSTSLSAFEKQFLDRLSNELGRVFYDFRTSEAF
jgi:hypothetical protein